MCLDKQLKLEKNAPLIGYKIFIKETATNHLRFIVNGQVCGLGKLEANQTLVKCNEEDSSYQTGFHYVASPEYLLYLLTRHNRTMKKKVERDLGLKLYTFDLVLVKVSVSDVYAKGTWWNDIHEGATAYVAKYMQVLEEVSVEQELVTA